MKTKNSNQNLIFVSIDVEASGPIPGEYSMLSFGACNVMNLEQTFYIELQPISDKFVLKALEVCGLSMDELKSKGVSPGEAMARFAQWLNWISDNGTTIPKMVGYNLGFDWQFINYYFIKYFGKNPLGISGIDTASVWFGKSDQDWTNTSKTKIKRTLNLELNHTHNALDDAIEQAIIFEKILTFDLKNNFASNVHGKKRN